MLTTINYIYGVIVIVEYFFVSLIFKFYSHTLPQKEDNKIITVRIAEWVGVISVIILFAHLVQNYISIVGCLVLLIYTRLPDTFESLDCIIDKKEAENRNQISIRRRIDLTTIAVTFVLIQPLMLINKCICWNKTNKNVLSDIIVLLVTIVFLSFMIFFEVLLLEMILEGLISKSDGNFSAIEKRIQKIIDLRKLCLKHKHLCERKISLKFKCLVVLVLFLFVVVDCILEFLSCIVAGILAFVLEIPLTIFYYIKKFIFRTTKFIFCKSERKMISYTYRSSFVFSIVIVEIMNKAGIIVFSKDYGNELFEFIASTIIIPIIISWILEIYEDNMINSNS